MSAPLVLETVEVHAAGEAGRIVTNASHLVEGATMAERLAHAKEHLDGLRRLLLREPRGYPGLCAVLLLPPVEPGSHFGMIVLEQGGFTPMSGSNTMCTVTAAVETGLVAVTGPDTEVVIDTAVGTVRATAHMDGGKVRAVTVANVPSFVVELDRPLDVPEIGLVPVDVVFGGQFFVQLRASDLGIPIDPRRGRDLTRAGALVKLAALEQVEVSHPLEPSISGVSLVLMHSGDRKPGEVARNANFLQSAPILRHDPATWSGTLDRSPCGTGTSARMAALHARGQLAIGEEFRHRSVIDSEFSGRLVGTTEVAGRPAVLPTVTGCAWITGRARWELDPTDPYPEGYTLGDIWAA